MTKQKNIFKMKNKIKGAFSIFLKQDDKRTYMEEKKHKGANFIYFSIISFVIK